MTNQYTLGPAKTARRRAAIVAYYEKHGAPATAERYSISRIRVYQLLHQEGVKPKRERGEA